jgi:hypothetical protein
VLDVRLDGEPIGRSPFTLTLSGVIDHEGLARAAEEARARGVEREAAAAAARVEAAARREQDAKLKREREAATAARQERYSHASSRQSPSAAFVVPSTQAGKDEAASEAHRNITKWSARVTRPKDIAEQSQQLGEKANAASKLAEAQRQIAWGKEVIRALQAAAR